EVTEDSANVIDKLSDFQQLTDIQALTLLFKPTSATIASGTARRHHSSGGQAACQYTYLRFRPITASTAAGIHLQSKYRALSSSTLQATSRSRRPSRRRPFKVFLTGEADNSADLLTAPHAHLSAQHTTATALDTQQIYTRWDEAKTLTFEQKSAARHQQPPTSHSFGKRGHILRRRRAAQHQAVLPSL
ncbi:hypothetical protein B484DRAFT_392613, partial [Ochromonadaceae sp. CCMP2298]